MSKQIFFIDNNDNFFSFESDNITKLSETKNMEYVIIDSDKIDFKFDLLPPINLLKAYQILINEYSNKFWIRLYLNKKNEFILKKYKRILQKIFFKNELSNISNICPIELIISHWCSTKTKNWWMFLFNENGIYRIIAGLERGILISRYLSINSEEELYEELYRTFLFIRRHDNTEIIEIFTNIQLKMDILDIFNIHKIDQENLIKMILNYAKYNKIFYSITCDKKLYLKSFINKSSSILSIILLIFTINNITDYIKYTNNLQDIESNIAKIFLKTSKLFNQNDINIILDFMKKVDNRNYIFDKIKKFSQKCNAQNIQKLLCKEKQFFIEFTTPVSELQLKENFKDINYEILNTTPSNGVNFTINKNNPNNGKYKIIELKL